MDVTHCFLHLIWKRDHQGEKSLNFLLPNTENRVLSEGIKVTDQNLAFTSSPFSTARKSALDKQTVSLQFINLFSPFLRDLAQDLCTTQSSSRTARSGFGSSASRAPSKLNLQLLLQIRHREAELCKLQRTLRFSKKLQEQFAEDKEQAAHARWPGWSLWIKAHAWHNLITFCTYRFSKMRRKD